MQTGTVPEAIDDEKWEAIPFPCKQGGDFFPMQKGDDKVQYLK